MKHRTQPLWVGSIPKAAIIALLCGSSSVAAAAPEPPVAKATAPAPPAAPAPAAARPGDTPGTANAMAAQELQLLLRRFSPGDTPATTSATAAPGRPLIGPAKEPRLVADDALAEALRREPGGMSMDEVAGRASKTSPKVMALRAEVVAAEARLDQALASYFPTLTLSATYTRLSEVDNSFDLGLPPAATGGAPTSLEFPSLLNSYALAASLNVPLSDYLLRLTQAYAGASLDGDARALSQRAEALQAASEAKITYLNWLRAKGRLRVAELAAEQARAHAADAKVSYEAGVISRADLSRLHAQHAQAEHLVRAASAFGQVSEQQLRTALHLKPTAPLRVGVDVLSPPGNRSLPPLETLQRNALSNRLELRALAKTEQSLRELKSIRDAGYAPRLDAFADALYANPNPRIFPQKEQWDFTWQVGLRLSWIVNDSFKTIGVSREAQAQADGVKHRAAALRDGIKVMVAAAYYELVAARSAITAADQREKAAVLSLDARRKLFHAGMSTAVGLIDADTELTRARLQRVDGHIDRLVAETKLDHATGADARKR